MTKWPVLQRLFMARVKGRRKVHAVDKKAKDKRERNGEGVRKRRGETFAQDVLPLEGRKYAEDVRKTEKRKTWRRGEESVVTEDEASCS